MGTCAPTCSTGYTVSGASSCTTGTLTAATCTANPCDASAAPTNGGVGDCTSSLASGSTCAPTCSTGYTVSGASSCTTGTLTAATCTAWCPSGCRSPSCEAGGTDNGGMTLASGKCSGYCSEQYEGVRYCGLATVSD